MKVVDLLMNISERHAYQSVLSGVNGGFTFINMLNTLR
jgi:hypothetical protein